LTGGGQQLQQSSSLLHRYAVHRAGSPLASTGSKQLSSSVGTAEQFYYRGAYPTPRPSPIPVATAVYPANKNNYSITVTSSQRATAGSSVGSLVEGQNWHAVSSANVCQQIKYGFTTIETGSDHRQSHSLPSTPKKVTTIS
jgi:hypothetical protein